MGILKASDVELIVNKSARGPIADANLAGSRPVRSRHGQRPVRPGDV